MQLFLLIVSEKNAEEIHYFMNISHDSELAGVTCKHSLLYLVKLRNPGDLDCFRARSRMCFLPPAIRRMGEGNSFSLFTFRGGVPGLRFSGRLIQPWTGGEGGSQVSDFRVG